MLPLEMVFCFENCSDLLREKNVVHSDRGYNITVYFSFRKMTYIIEDNFQMVENWQDL